MIGFGNMGIRRKCGPGWSLAALPLILGLTAFFLFPMLAQAQSSLRIAAVVNDDVITAFDVEQRLRLVLANSPREPNQRQQAQLRRGLLRTLIDERLKLQEATRLGFAVTEDDIASAIGNLESRNNMPRGQLLQQLARKGISEEALRSQIEANMAWQKVVGRRLRSQVTVTEAEVNTMIDEMEARRGEPEYRIAEIFLAVESPSEEARVRTEINRIFAGLREGAPFRQLAENFSESASAAVGGDLGWVQRGELDPVIDQALQNLTPNQASPPLRTTNGYVIVFLIQKRLSQGLGVQVDDTFDIKQIFFDLPSNAAPAQVAQTNTRAEAIRRSATSCEAMDQLAKANGSPLSGDLGRMKSSDLPEAIRQAVSDLPVGRASAPVRTTAGLVVLMVCGREEGDVAAARATAFRNIENRLMQERLGVVARRYTRDLRRSAFIEIRQ